MLTHQKTQSQKAPVSESFPIVSAARHGRSLSENFDKNYACRTLCSQGLSTRHGSCSQPWNLSLKLFPSKEVVASKWFIIYKREHTSFSFCPCSCYETSGLKCPSFFNLLKKFIKHVFYSRESGAENRNVNFNVHVLSQSRLAKEDEKTSCIIFPFSFLYFLEWKQGRVILDKLCFAYLSF